MKNTHDLRLPAWGPYTKKYAGISHIPRPAAGLRFDLSVFPGFYRRFVQIPNVKHESGFHPWEASPDLNYFAFRHELEWKDRVYVDVAYARTNDTTRLIRCQAVNRTESPQNLVLHFMAYANFPPVGPGTDEAIRPAVVKLPKSGCWIDALDYADLTFRRPRPTDNLVPDGFLRGEIRGHEFVNGSAVRLNADSAGDVLTFDFSLKTALKNATLLLRGSAPEGATLLLAGIVDAQIKFEARPGRQLLPIPVGKSVSGNQQLTITTLRGGVLDFDGFVVCENRQINAVQFDTKTWQPVPEIISGPTGRAVILKYPDFPDYYGIGWDFPDFEQRAFHCRHLDTFMRRTIHDHVSKKLTDQHPEQHFTNIFLRPITVPPDSEREIHGWVTSGTLKSVRAELTRLAENPAEHPAIFQQERQRRVTCSGHPAGKAYVFSQEKMAATSLTNVVYPIYVRRNYIRHNSPGRWWDCLYTWDSGFTGLGLLQLDRTRALDCLNAYLTERGDPHAAFLHHGSPVPTQFYLFLEIRNRFPEQNLLEWFYPRLKQYYEFLAGKTGSSTTATLKSGLLKTWDYFYNSGGWDDYPPQHYLTKRPALRDRVTPVITTTQVIRSAKILKMAALALNLPADAATFEADIQRLSQALHTHAWDAKAQYFSYVVHDSLGHPKEFLRHRESGENFNRGMDGMSPLVAGCCTAEQETRFFRRLQDSQQFRTPIGLSTVDMTAPYFRKDGYWNGAVWMPHQWFFWKTSLDHNRPDFAWQIAKTALEVWQNEVDTTYNCFEHFMIESGRGAGWHQFSALSSPVLDWYRSYFLPGHLTTGFEVWVKAIHFSANHQEFQADLRTFGRVPLAVVVSLNPDYAYQVQWNQQNIPHQLHHPGVLAIELPGQSEGVLQVSAI